MLEVEFDRDVEIVVNNNIEVTASNTNVAIVEDTNDIEVTVNRQEYVITGDEIYIPKRFEDAPTWMQNLITQVVDTSISAQIQDLNEISQSLESMIEAMEVAKNTYEMSIISSNDIDQRINTAVTTLNSSMQEADSTILEVAQTRVTPEEASAITIDVISAQLGSTTAGTIGATVSELQTAIANEEEARSTSIEILTSSIEGAFDANATAMNYLNTYVGVDDLGGLTGTGLLADVEILQKQNDGVIETTTGTYDVMINPENPNLAQLVTTSEPYAAWRALDTTGISNRLAHIGDVYVKYSDTANGAKEYIASYKFIRTEIDNTSPYATDSDGFTWALVIDQAAQDAYEQALNAYDLADNKRRVFVSNPTVPYDIGDLWLIQTGSSIIGTTQGGRVIQAGDMLRCSETKEVNGLYEHNDWIPADNYREGMNAIQADLNSWRTGTYASFVTSIQTQVDGKSETFYQNSIPTGRIKSLNVASNSTLDKYVGDLWKNIYIGTVGGYLGNNTEYVYTKTANGSNWNYDWTKMEVPDIVFDTIDTKKSIYSGDSVPIAVAPDAVEINDMWITGSAVVAGYDKESIYVWNGTSWIKPLKYTDDTATTLLQTGLANGTTTIKLTNAYVGSTPLLTYISTEIDGKIGVYSGETAPVNGQPSGVSINDIYLWFTTASKVLADGTTQVYDITRTYKYSGSSWSEITTDSNITALADLADGKRTVFSGNTVPVGAVNRDVWIPSATNGLYLQGEIYQYSGAAWVVATKYSAEIATINTDLSEKALELANLDNRIDAEEQARIDAILLEEQARIDAINERILADADLDGRIDTEEQARINAINDVSDAYKEYSRVVTLAIADGVLTPEEEALIADASMAVTAAKDRLQGIIDKAEDDLNGFVDAVYQPMITSLQNQIDGKIENWFTISTNDPKASWVDADTKLKHNGDLWYQTDTKISYYYTSSTHAWNILDDAKAIQALADAATAQTAANNAQTSANNAQTSADTANSLLADIASDSKFTPSEKSLVKKEWDSIQSEYTKNLAQGASYSVSTAAYTTAYNALNTYITPLLASLTTTSDIVGTTFRDTFKSYYDANVDLLNAISNKINLIADGKITSYYMATFSAVQAMSAAWTVGEKASNIGDLAVVYNDTTVDNNGTWRWDGANWVTTRDKKLVALASQVTALSTDLQSGDGTWADADSTLTNSLTTTINDKTAAVESKFAYNSIVGINGVYKKSGFGLTTNYVSGSGTEVDPYVSEFWIDASRFKFTNSNVTGSVLPFTIDATGAVPQITFNGNVTFEAVDAVYSNALSSNTSTNNDVFAQRLGYMNYADMVAAATAGQTIINGGYLRSNLIAANSINAGQINTTGLVAENISSNTLDGKTITGSFITGAVITGATIKASYIDLDGELEVLTDFYLCVGGDTTGVPALAISEGRYRTYNSLVDTDAIPSSGYANIYRIPTLSTVTVSTSFTSLSSGQTLYATLWSYNTANVNNNKKARKKRPAFNQGAGIIFQFTEYRNDSSYEEYDLCNHSLKLGNIALLNFSFFGWSGKTGGSGGQGVANTGFSWSKYGGQSGYKEYANPYVYIQKIDGYAQTFITSSTITAIPVIGDVNIAATIVVTPREPLSPEDDWSYPSQVTFTVTCSSSGYELPFDWITPSDRLYWIRNNAKGGGQCRFLNLSINNMI